jgi:hypothetical protein
MDEGQPGCSNEVKSPRPGLPVGSGCRSGPAAILYLGASYRLASDGREDANRAYEIECATTNNSAVGTTAGVLLGMVDLGSIWRRMSKFPTPESGVVDDATPTKNPCHQQNVTRSFWERLTPGQGLAVTFVVLVVLPSCPRI